MPAGQERKLLSERGLQRRAKVKSAAKEGHVQATAAGMAGGAATLGATGAATGLLSGAAVGAALGVVPALFTFGLSIPLGAVLGGVSGCAVGTTAGVATGAMSGAAAGYGAYGAYASRDELRQMGQTAMSRVCSGVDLVRGKAAASADFVKHKASAVQASFAKAKAG